MTTDQMRKKISVYDIIESSEKIIIGYWKDNFIYRLEVKKNSTDELLEWVDGPVCQYDAINMVVQFEMQQLLIINSEL